MKKILLIAAVTVQAAMLYAQRSYDVNVLQGEVGVTLGVAHYFGDLNTRAKLNRLKPAVGLFYRKQFNNYLGMRISAHYAQLGYSDVYSKNLYQKTRNLSFNSDIVELAVHGDFNFFRFVPGDPDYKFTPYVTLGLGVFSYNPYAYLNNKKIFLRPLGTEGQNIGYVDPVTNKKRKAYGSMAVCVPVGIGVKYNINDKVNLSFQIAQRLTLTDYLDDISTTYIGLTNALTGLPNFPNPNAVILQDRSFEKGNRIGVEGRQRGWSKQRDQYLIAEIGISLNFNSYKCPTF